MQTSKTFKSNAHTKICKSVQKEKKGGSGKIKDFFAKLSRGLMLPIAILPMAGLLLGIGGAITSNVAQGSAGYIVGDVFKSMSEVVFACLPILFCVAITITFSNDKGATGFCAVIAFLVFCSTQIPFIQTEKLPGQDIKYLSILWFHKGDHIAGIITSTLGMATLQISIFGGIIVGALTSLIYNKISVVKLPQVLDFFSGVRLVPIVLIPVMLALSLLFLVFWPWIGQGIYMLGANIQKGSCSGTGGLLYGALGRCLMPFGLHHIPIILAYQTEFGGVLVWDKVETALRNSGESDEVIKRILETWEKFSKGPATVIVGDQKIWNLINILPFNTLKTAGGGSLPLFEWFTTNVGAYPGRFTQDYPTYLGLCMGIGAAIIFTAEKNNRRGVLSVVGSSMAVAFLTGITEPLEFSFLFCAPLLYFIAYVPMSGFSYMFMELCNAHVGVGFARGFIDLMIYGALPVAKGTNFFWAFVLAAGEGLFIFLIFFFSIKIFDLPTPGRKDNPMNLITKKEYIAIKESQNGGKKMELDVKTEKIIALLGGTKNIKSVSACATRLRITLKDSKNINGQIFVPLGSQGAIIKGNSMQLIFGGQATILSDKINEKINQK